VSKDPAAPKAKRTAAKHTTKMEFALNVRGKVPLAVTAEYATPEETAENARKAIRLFREICTEEGLNMGDQPF